MSADDDKFYLIGGYMAAIYNLLFLIMDPITGRTLGQRPISEQKVGLLLVKEMYSYVHDWYISTNGTSGLGGDLPWGLAVGGAQNKFPTAPDSCPRCQAALNTFQAIISLMRGSDWSDKRKLSYTGRTTIGFFYSLSRKKLEGEAPAASQISIADTKASEALTLSSKWTQTGQHMSDIINMEIETKKKAPAANASRIDSFRYQDRLETEAILVKGMYMHIDNWIKTNFPEQVDGVASKEQVGGAESKRLAALELADLDAYAKISEEAEKALSSFKETMTSLEDIPGWGSEKERQSAATTFRDGLRQIANIATTTTTTTTPAPGFTGSTTMLELNSRYDEIDRKFIENVDEALKTESVEEEVVSALNMTDQMDAMINLYLEAQAKVSSIDEGLIQSFSPANLGLQWKTFTNEYAIPWATTLTKSQNKIIWMIDILQRSILPRVSNMAAASASLTAKKVLSGADIDIAPSQAEARLAIELRQVVSSLPVGMSSVEALNWEKILLDPDASKDKVLNLVKGLINNKLNTEFLLAANVNLINVLSKLLEVAKQQVVVGGVSDVKL